MQTALLNLCNGDNNIHAQFQWLYRQSLLEKDITATRVGSMPTPILFGLVEIDMIKGRHCQRHCLRSLSLTSKSIEMACSCKIFNFGLAHGRFTFLIIITFTE
jgi:hypothetical protein